MTASVCICVFSSSLSYWPMSLHFSFSLSTCISVFLTLLLLSSCDLSLLSLKHVFLSVPSVLLFFCLSLSLSPVRLCLLSVFSFALRFPFFPPLSNSVSVFFYLHLSVSLPLSLLSLLPPPIVGPDSVWLGHLECRQDYR